MKQDKIKVVYVDCKQIERNKKFRYITINNDLEEFYKLLNCRTIDIPTRKIKYRNYDFIVDDEFLLKMQDEEKLYPSVALIKNNEIKEIFFGNVIICSHDIDGNLTSLTNFEALTIMNTLTNIYDKKENKYQVIKTNY